ncbi:MAG TPA: YihY/virulence factor BrkB family protein [Chloroflexi bacterium]|nr:YihY/virulence factor BrkB family protein [Chloroflexota bacterium]
MKELKESTIKNIIKFYKTGNQLSGGWAAVLRSAINRFGEVYATQAAASIAYYTFFSIFPLLILLAALGSFFLEGDQIQNQIAFWVNTIFPPAADLVEQTLSYVIQQRKSAGITGMIGLLWAGSAAFIALGRNITLAWPKAHQRDFLRGRLMAFAMIASIIALLIGSIIVTTVVRVSSVFELSLLGGNLMGNLLSWLMTFITMISLYRWLPTETVRWKHAAWGALLATVGWHTAAIGFSWYLSSGLARYDLIYGTLSAVIVLLFWIYISALIILFGAHFTAALCRKRRRK